jgi:hypothetical protein
MRTLLQLSQLLNLLTDRPLVHLNKGGFVSLLQVFHDTLFIRVLLTYLPDIVSSVGPCFTCCSL